MNETGRNLLPTGEGVLGISFWAGSLDFGSETRAIRQPSVVVTTACTIWIKRDQCTEQ